MFLKIFRLAFQMNIVKQLNDFFSEKIMNYIKIFVSNKAAII